MRALSAFRNLNYRLFYFGQVVSQSGTWMQRVAQSWLVLQLTDSPFALGTVTALQFIPMLVLSLFGGVIADRFRKRNILVVTQGIMATQAVVIAVLTSTGQIQLWHIYALAGMLGLANAFDSPTRQALVVELVGPKDVANAVALNSSLVNTARIAGPAIGGTIVATAGVAVCFWLNAVSFLAVIGALLAMRPSQFFDVAISRRGALLSQIGEGLSYAIRTRDVCLAVLVLGVLGTFGYNFNVFIPLLARYALDIGAVGYGILFSCLGVGSVIAAFGLAGRREASERTLLAGGAAFTILLFLVALSPWFLATAGLLALLGAAGIVFSTTANTRMQLAAPAELRGRVMSIYTLLLAGTTPIGSFVVGTLSEPLGISRALAICAGLCALGMGAGLLYARRAPRGAAVEGESDGASYRSSDSGHPEPRSPASPSAAS
jgi:MFS family permease